MLGHAKLTTTDRYVTAKFRPEEYARLDAAVRSAPQAAMPRLSAFYGIVIAMYHREHGLRHFHAVYAGQRASIALETLEVLDG